MSQNQSDLTFGSGALKQNLITFPRCTVPFIVWSKRVREANFNLTKQGNSFIITVVLNGSVLFVCLWNFEFKRIIESRVETIILWIISMNSITTKQRQKVHFKPNTSSRFHFILLLFFLRGLAVLLDRVLLSYEVVTFCSTKYSSNWINYLFFANLLKALRFICCK